MSYVNLGKYNFMTGPDYTGLNTGNLTSILSLATIRVPYFEMYRMLVNTSSIPGTGGGGGSAPLPSVVQTTSAHGTSTSTLGLTFSKNTTAGNTIVVVLMAYATSTNPTVSGITLNAAADNFGVVATGGSASTPYSTIWADPDTAEASTALVVTFTGGSGTCVTQAYAYELAGTFSTSTPADAVDVTGGASNDSNATKNWTNVASGNSTTNNDLVIAMTGAFQQSSSTISNSTTGWTNLAQIGPTYLSASSAYLSSLSSWQLAASSGNAPSATYTENSIAYWTSVIAAFLPGVGTPSSSPVTSYNFTVAVDGNVWDQQQTASGIGYTYQQLGANPLYLNPGQTLQILWDLPLTTYATYAPNFDVTAWFRYDPSVQPS